MKSLSNVIPFDFVLKIKFDRDFIFTNDAKKKRPSQGNIVFFVSIKLCHRGGGGGGSGGGGCCCGCGGDVSC